MVDSKKTETFGTMLKKIRLEDARNWAPRIRGFDRMAAVKSQQS